MKEKGKEKTFCGFIILGIATILGAGAAAVHYLVSGNVFF